MQISQFLFTNKLEKSLNYNAASCNSEMFKIVVNRPKKRARNCRLYFRLLLIFSSIKFVSSEFVNFFSTASTQLASRSAEHYCLLHSLAIGSGSTTVRAQQSLRVLLAVLGITGLVGCASYRGKVFPGCSIQCRCGHQWRD